MQLRFCCRSGIGRCGSDACLQVAASLQQLQDFLQGTLLCVQQRRLCTDGGLQDAVLRCIHTLCSKDLITAADPHAATLQVTRLGRAAYKGGSRIAVRVLRSSRILRPEHRHHHSLKHRTCTISRYHGDVSEHVHNTCRTPAGSEEHQWRLMAEPCLKIL